MAAALTNAELTAALTDAAAQHRTARALGGGTSIAEEVLARRINELLDELHHRHHP